MSLAAIYKDNEGSDQIKGFSVDKVMYRGKARIIGSPIEDGQVSFDNKVRDPYELVVVGTIVIDDEGEWADTVGELEEMLTSRDFKFYSVCDGAILYRNLMLESFPHTRNVDELDFMTCELVYKQIQLVQKDKGGKSANSEHSSTRNLGYQSGVAR